MRRLREEVGNIDAHVANLVKEDLQYDVHTGDGASHAVDETHFKTPTLEEFFARGVFLQHIEESWLNVLLKF